MAFFPVSYSKNVGWKKFYVVFHFQSLKFYVPKCLWNIFFVCSRAGAASICTFISNSLKPWASVVFGWNLCAVVFQSCRQIVYHVVDGSSFFQLVFCLSQYESCGCRRIFFAGFIFHAKRVLEAFRWWWKFYVINFFFRNCVHNYFFELRR